MRFLQYLEKAWIVAAAVALVVALYNLITLRTINTRVYFPLFCAMFCLLLWYNVRGQRRFRDKMVEQEKERNKQKDESN